MSKISAYALVKVSRAIDFGEITPGCNLSTIGLRDGIAAKLGNAGRPNPPHPGVKIVRTEAGKPKPPQSENRSRTKSLLYGLQSIFAAPSPWWQYTFAHQTPKSNTQNQHQPRHQFWKERKRLKSPPTHWSRAIAPEIQTLETK